MQRMHKWQLHAKPCCFWEQASKTSLICVLGRGTHGCLWKQQSCVVNERWTFWHCLLDPFSVPILEQLWISNSCATINIWCLMLHYQFILALWKDQNFNTVWHCSEFWAACRIQARFGALQPALISISTLNLISKHEIYFDISKFINGRTAKKLSENWCM